MEWNICNTNVKGTLLGFALIVNVIADLPVANYNAFNSTVSNMPDVSLAGLIPLNVADMRLDVVPPSIGKDTLHYDKDAKDWNYPYCSKDLGKALRSNNYYELFDENRKYGGCILHQIGNGNKEYISINGMVSKCLLVGPEAAFKKYGNETYKYDYDFNYDIEKYQQSPTHRKDLTDSFRRDLEALYNPITTWGYIPTVECVKNLLSLRSYSEHMQAKGYEMANSECKEDSDACKRRRAAGQYIMEFFRTAYSSVYSVILGGHETTTTSNNDIRKNRYSIFPSTARVAEATAGETSKGKCDVGVLRKYVKKNREKTAICVGDNVNGKYIKDYLTEYPETKDWVPDTFGENVKYNLGKLKESLAESAQNISDAISEFISRF